MTCPTTPTPTAAHDTGAAGALHALTSRIASDAGVEPTRDAAELLAGLHAVGAADAIRTMAPRVVEAVDVEDPYDVAARLNALRGVGAEEQIRALLARDPGRHASLGRTGGVADLLAALQAASYRFGREPDGTPAPPWTWPEPA